MVRQQGTAPGTALCQAVRRVGYTASVIPTMRLALNVPDMDCQGCPEKVQKTLMTRRGVRGVQFPSRKQVVVFYDGRRLNQETIVRAIRGTGLSCPSKEG